MKCLFADIIPIWFEIISGKDWDSEHLVHYPSSGQHVNTNPKWYNLYLMYLDLIDHPENQCNKAYIDRVLNELMKVDEYYNRSDSKMIDIEEIWDE